MVDKTDICRIKEKAIEWMDVALAQPMECINAEEVGYVADIIKDMCQAHKYMAEACYYEHVIDAMESGTEKNSSWYPDNHCEPSV